MRISLNFIARILGMIALSYLGLRVGQAFSSPNPNASDIQATQLLALAGAGLGLLTTPRWTIDLVAAGLQYVRSISITELTSILFGALLGLFFAVLLSVPLSNLPGSFGQLLPILGAILFAYLGANIFSTRKREFGELLRSFRASPLVLPSNLLQGESQPTRFLIDTSAIIDGRVVAVSEADFLDGTLLVPTFVLNELQMLADSSDDLRRERGKRGLEMLNTLQKQSEQHVDVINVEVPSVQEVDDKLIVLAGQYQCPIITNDHNLGRIANLQGVKVLNMNQLADAVRPPVIPGQEITVRVRDVGREREQGISFLDDGTMIVIEDARSLIGQQVHATVTRVFQTQTGRIVFAQLRSLGNEHQ